MAIRLDKTRSLTQLAFGPIFGERRDRPVPALFKSFKRKAEGVVDGCVLGGSDRRASFRPCGWRNGRSVDRNSGIRHHHDDPDACACIERGSLFGHPVSRWIAAGGRATAEYRIFIAETDREVEAIEYRDGAVRAPGLFELA